MRTLAIRLLAPLLLLFFLMVTLVSAQPATPASTAELNFNGFPRFGVYVRDHTDLTGSVLAQQAGARWIHLLLMWNQVEATQGVYDWSAPDNYLGNAAAEGYNIILTIQSNPDWAADTPCGPLHAENKADFANFLAAAAARYSVPPYNVRFWALYNEPDNADAVDHQWLGGCWGKGHANSAVGAGGDAYAKMLKLAYTTIKGVNPNVFILLGGIAYDYFTTVGGIFDPNFLDDMLAAGGGDYVDMINFHYFPTWGWAWNTGDPYSSDIIGKARWIQDQFFQYTGRLLPILTTEVGQPSSGPTGSIVPFSEELSARYVIQLFARSMAAGLFPVIWFEAVDAPDESYAYGLLRSDLTPKPAYYAYIVFIDELGGAIYLYNLGEVAMQAQSAAANNSVEGYVFDVLGHKKYAIWSRTGNTASYTFTFDAPDPRLRVVDKSGAETIVQDGGPGDADGVINGSITMRIGPSPLIIEDISLNQRLFTPVVITR